MLVSVFSPKGGVGVSTTSALFAKSLYKNQDTLLVETSRGDLEAMLALENCVKFGFFDWAVSENPRSESLNKISAVFDSGLGLVAGCAQQNSNEDEYSQRQQDFLANIEFNYNPIVTSLAGIEGHCVVDCGRGETQIQKKIIEASDVVVLVLRQCYLGLYRATQSDLLEKVDAVLVVQESGRSISSNQIVETLNCNVLLEIEARRDFARAIDAGILWSRTPEKLLAPIDDYVSDLLDAQDSTNVSNDVFENSLSRNQFDFWNETSESDTTKEISKVGMRFGDHTRRLLSQERR